MVVSRKMDPKPPTPAPHQDDADEEDDNVKQLDECSVLYLSLQDCLVKTNRDWKSCQTVSTNGLAASIVSNEFAQSLFLEQFSEVQALKACNDKRKNVERK